MEECGILGPGRHEIVISENQDQQSDDPNPDLARLRDSEDAEQEIRIEDKDQAEYEHVNREDPQADGGFAHRPLPNWRNRIACWLISPARRRLVRVLRHCDNPIPGRERPQIGIPNTPRRLHGEEPLPNDRS
jgi:hypothetical protein